jgi:hypothetical protein
VEITWVENEMFYAIENKQELHFGKILLEIWEMSQVVIDCAFGLEKEYS